MKKIIYSLIYIFTILFVTSCDLTETSFIEKEKSEFMRNASEAETVLLGVYENLTADAMYGYHLSLYFPLGTDQAKVTGYELDGFRNVPSNFYTPAEQEVLDTWAALYNGIYDANDFIERLSVNVENFPEGDKNKAAIYMAEARALRALFYFELVRWYGNIVLMKTTAESLKHPSTYEQSSPEEVYEYIEQDLQYAIKTLPYASEDTYRADNSFRISKAAAIGLLTKVYCTWAGYPVRDESKWQKAVATAKPLIESGKHGLLADFETLWENTNNNIWDPTESLLEVSFYAMIISGGDPVGRIGKWNGVSAASKNDDYIRISACWTVVPTFLSQWPEYEKDKRFRLSFADYSYNLDKTKKYLWTDSKTGVVHPFEEAIPESVATGGRAKFNANLYPAKWDMVKYVDNIISDANFSNTNWYLLRYADVLLLYAEALNELNKNPTSDAYAAINMVRRRAGLSNLKTGYSYDEFRKAVHNERSYELCFEGHRRQDLVRWGTYYEAIKQTQKDLASWDPAANDYYLVGEYTEKGKHELLPIPQRELDLMKKCTQNPNW